MQNPPKNEKFLPQKKDVNVFIGSQQFSGDLAGKWWWKWWCGSAGGEDESREESVWEKTKKMKWRKGWEWASQREDKIEWLWGG